MEWFLFFTFFGVSNRNFFRNEKILFLAKIIAFLNLKNTYNYIAHANFNRDSPKMIFKIYLLSRFLRHNPYKITKHIITYPGYKLGILTKILSNHNSLNHHMTRAKLRYDEYCEYCTEVMEHCGLQPKLDNKLH